MTRWNANERAVRDGASIAQGNALETAGSGVAAVEFVKSRASFSHRECNFDIIAPLL